MRRRLALSWFALEFPADFAADHAATFCRLLATRPVYGWWRQPDPVVCEAAGTADGVRWRVGMSPREAAMLVPQLRSMLAGVAFEPADRDLPPLGWAVELVPDTNLWTLRTDTGEQVAAAILTGLGQATDTEAVVWSWMVGPPLPRPLPHEGDPTGYAAPPLDAEEADALADKLTEPVLGVVGRVGVNAQPERCLALAQRVIGALELARVPGAGFTIGRAGRRVADRLVTHRAPLFWWPALNTAELAAVLGWPVGNPYVEGVAYKSARRLPPTAALWVPATSPEPTGDHRVVGRSTYPGRDGWVHLPIGDALRHLHVIGPTGSGKSVLLSRMIETDIRSGLSVVVIEPKADLISAVIDRMPEHRTDDVVLVDPTDPDYAVGLDTLGGPDAEVAADRLVSLLAQLSSGSWGPRTAQVLYTAAVALARTGGSLVDLPQLLTDADYRRHIVDQVPDPVGTDSFWHWYDQLSEREQGAAIGPALSRLAAFTGRRAIRGHVGQRSPRFHMGDLFSGRKVLLVNLAGGLIGQGAARLLGALVFGSLWQTTLAQSVVPEDQRQPVAAYVDEFQSYVGGVASDFEQMLAQARGLGLALTLAHQAMDQLDRETAAGVLVNARSRIVFQQTGAAARELADALGEPLTPRDLTGLPPYNAYAALFHGGATTPPVSIATLPPAAGAGTTNTVKARSQQLWAQPRDDIDAEILATRRNADPAAAAPALGGIRHRENTP